MLSPRLMLGRLGRHVLPAAITSAAACSPAVGGHDSAGAYEKQSGGAVGCADVVPLLEPFPYHCDSPRGIDVLHAMLSLGDSSLNFAHRVGYAKKDSIINLIKKWWLFPIPVKKLSRKRGLQRCLDKIYLLPIPIQLSKQRIRDVDGNLIENHVDDKLIEGVESYFETQHVDEIIGFFPSSAFHRFHSGRIQRGRNTVSKTITRKGFSELIGAAQTAVNQWYPPTNNKITTALLVKNIALLRLLHMSVAHFVADSSPIQKLSSGLWFSDPSMDVRSKRLVIAFLSVIDFYFRISEIKVKNKDLEKEMRDFHERWSIYGLDLIRREFHFQSGADFRRSVSWGGWPEDLTKKTLNEWRSLILSPPEALSALHPSVAKVFAQ